MFESWLVTQKQIILEQKRIQHYCIPFRHKPSCLFVWHLDQAECQCRWASCFFSLIELLIADATLARSTFCYPAPPLHPVPHRKAMNTLYKHGSVVLLETLNDTWVRRERK